MGSLRYSVSECVLNLSGSQHGPVPDSSEHGNGISRKVSK
jgi:hypothetical protein